MKSYFLCLVIVAVGFSFLPRGRALTGLRSVLGQEERGYIGVYVEGKGNGVLVTDVMQGLAADRAGIVKGDLIVGLGAHDVDRFGDLEDILDQTRPGEAILVTVRRGESRLQLPVVLTSKWDSKHPKVRGERRGGWQGSLQRFEDESREWAHSFQGRMEELARELEERGRGLESSMQGFADELEGQAQAGALDRLREELTQWARERELQLRDVQRSMERLEDRRQRRMEELRGTLEREFQERLFGMDEPGPPVLPRLLHTARKAGQGLDVVRDGVEELRAEVGDLRREIQSLRDSLRD